MRIDNKLPDEKDAYRSELAESLKTTLESHGWREVAVPRMRDRCEAIKTRLAVGKIMDIEEVRKLQAQYAVLDDILENPFQFFMPPKR